MVFLTGAKRREFSGMIHFITSNVIIPATPSNPSIPYVKRTSKSMVGKKQDTSGKRLHSYGKSPFFQGKTHYFNGKLLVYQRVYSIKWMN
jgi:hypothetical protein